MATEIAFVAGATGLTGRHIALHLVQRGNIAVAHVRPDSPRLAEWRVRFSSMGATVDTSRWDLDAIRQTITERKPALIFACLGTTRARAKDAARKGHDASRETYDAVDVEMTEMLITAARSSGSLSRFVYLSSIGAGPNARGSYLQARARVENVLIESGLPYTIVRPSFIVGDRDVPRPEEKITAPVVNAALSLLGVLGGATIRDRYRSISGVTLADAMVSLAIDPAWRNRIAQGEDLWRIHRSRASHR
jgi:uncharacterized protein YbjT (DUF2867 family)